MKLPRSLVSIVASRILAFAALAIVIQTSVVFAEYWFDESELGRLLVEHETNRIAEAYRLSQRDGTAFPGDALARRYGLASTTPASREDDEMPGDEVTVPGYFFRVRSAGGPVLYSNCGHECSEHFLPPDLDPPSFWDRMIEPVKPLTVAGGRTFPGAGTDAPPLVVDFASVDDPASLVIGVIASEMKDHMVVPMGLMLFLVIGATILSIRKALRPVEAAAEAADALDPGSGIARIPAASMPREVAHLTKAVNRALKRVGELVRSQALFAASIAHEIRTPVAIVKLELERIDHPGARRAERDLEALTHTLEQLTSLARLDHVQREAFVNVKLTDIARDTVEQLAPYVYAHGHSIEFQTAGEVEVDAVPALVVVLIRNLVENAVKHTEAGTSITVAVDAPNVLSVSDTGQGFSTTDGPAATEFGNVKRSGSLGLGLKIAERIAVLHGGRMFTQSTPGGGARVVIELPAGAAA